MLKKLIAFIDVLFNRRAFQNIYCMLRHGGNVLVIIVASHDIFEVIKIMARDIRFSAYIQVNFIIYIFVSTLQP